MAVVGISKEANALFPELIELRKERVPHVSVNKGGLVAEGLFELLKKEKKLADKEEKRISAGFSMRVEK